MKKKKLVTYLCSGMEYKRKGGTEWRKKITKLLDETFYIDIQDPTKDESKKTGMSLANSILSLKRWKKTGQVKKIQSMMKRVIEFDINCVKQCDFMIVYWEAQVPTTGTIAEIQVAYDNNVPILFITADKLSDISSWLIAEWTERFKNFNELIIYLKGRYNKYIKES